MILKEAIERYTNNAEYERIHGSLQGCLDFRQLAEWLKDYKRLLEQEPKTGHWIDYKEGRWIYAQCSVCGEVHDNPSNYCPSCGRRMIEPQESEE